MGVMIEPTFIFLSSFDLFKIISFFLILCLTIFVYAGSKSTALPPGPINLPIVGYIPFMAFKKLEKAFGDLKKKYGDVVYFRLGAITIVTLNSYETIREVLITNNNTSTTRPTAFSSLTYIACGIGMGVENGQKWKEQRRFLNSTLRDMGVSSQILEQNIREEASALIDVFGNNTDRPFDPHEIMRCAAANVVSSLTFGIRYGYDDREISKLRNMFVTFAREINPFHPVCAFPYIRHVLPKYLSGISQWDQLISNTHKYAKEKIEEHNSHPQLYEDYITSYLKQQQEDMNKGLKDSIYDNARLVSNVLALGAAGTTSTALVLYWAFKMAITYPEIQYKLHKEIDAIIGHERIPSYSDKPNMPYTDAFLSEVMRYSDAGPFGMPHSSTEPTKIAGYTIPAGATIVPNLFLVHQDPKIWGDPEKFRPERFLGEEGKSKMKYVILFGLGKRSCPGENIARIEMFIFLTTILQHFEISAHSDEDTKLKLTSNQYVREPEPFKISVQRRDITANKI